jgi:hypothetical protein
MKNGPKMPQNGIGRTFLLSTRQPLANALTLLQVRSLIGSVREVRGSNLLH